MNHPLAFVGVDDGAELGLLVIAMFAILILAGLYLISQIFSKAFSRIPVVGPPIGRAFDWVTRWARGAMMATFHGLLWACGKIAHAVMALLTNMYQAQLDVVRAIIDAAEHTRFTVLPREITAARQFANNVANQVYYQARAYTNQEIARVNRTIDALRASTARQLLDLQNTLVKLVNATRQVLDARITAAVGQLTAQIQALGRKEAADIAKVEADIKAGDAAATAAAIAQALADVDTEAHNAALRVWAGIDTQAQQLAQQLGTDFPDVAKLIQLIPTQAPTDLALAVAASINVALPTLQLATDCIVPQCRDLGPLRDLLHQLADAGWLALLLAWLVFCITDPQAAAADTAAVVDPIAGAVMTPLLDLLGAH